jgi:hypothetical protein
MVGVRSPRFFPRVWRFSTDRTKSDAYQATEHRAEVFAEFELNLLIERIETRERMARTKQRKSPSL